MVPDQTDRRKAPSSGLLGLSARSAASAATPLRAVLRVRGQRPLPAGPTPASSANFLFSQFKVLLNFFQKIAGSRGSEATEVWVPDQTSGAQAPFFGGLLGLSARSALRATPPQFALRAGCRFFPKRKFYSIFSKKSRFPKAVRQRKFGFQPKLPGRKRPSSGDFSDLRSEARHTPRRPLSLPYGRGVGAPSP